VNSRLRNAIGSTLEGGALRRAHSYARYSKDTQNECSIEDQQRIANGFAKEFGAYVPEGNAFSDAAKRGGVIDRKRPGWFALKKLIEAGAVSILVADEHSRFFRDEMECVIIKRLIMKHGITVKTRNVDTRQSNWGTTWTFNGLVSTLENENTRDRIKRAQTGIVERGTAAGQPPYGYSRKVYLKATGERDYTDIEINPQTSAVVKRAFAERIAGRTLNEIAKGFIEDGIPCPSAARKGKCDVGGFWYSTQISVLFTRKLYKGLYEYGPNQASRPHLALVSAADWDKVQSKGNRRSPRHLRGGGVYWSAGLTQCTCGCLLSAQSSRRPNGSYREVYLRCQRCCHLRRLSVGRDRVTQTSERHLKELLITGLQMILTEDRLAEFRAEIRRIGAQSNEDEIAIEKAKGRNLERKIIIYTQALGELGEEGLNAMIQKLADLRDEKCQVKLRIIQLEAGAKSITKTEVDQQISSSPALLVPRLMAGKLPPGELRALLRQIFPLILLEDNTGNDLGRGPGVRFQSTATFVFSINVGALFSTESGTTTLETSHPTFRAKVTKSFKPGKRTKKGPWRPKLPQASLSVEVLGHDIKDYDVGPLALNARCASWFENQRLKHIDTIEEMNNRGPLIRNGKVATRAA
jgi:DNA invertase Pin-like site-specific DNA recombinase